jgi:branched-chain amino acid transport system ATP-binding protein
MTLLETHGLSRRYAGLLAVDSVDLAVPEGGVHAVIGPNGAGKTTLFNLISGLATASEGSIRFHGRDITRDTADRRARAGMARTFQNIRIFGDMSVLDNALTGLHPVLTSSLPAIVARLASFRREERRAVARAGAALALVGLHGRALEPAGALSYGDQRRLEIARAMAGGPRLLLLDEPAAGMNPAERMGLAVLIRDIVESGTTMLLVEHDMPFVMDLAKTVTVLNFGRRIFHGAPADARQDAGVVEAYLGHKLAAHLAAGAR